MSENPKEFGRAIGRDEANSILSKYTGIMEEAKAQLAPVMSKAMGLAPAERLLFSGYNGFIFSRELIERFFHDKDASKHAEYLVVLLGAHPKDADGFKEGEPTVLVVGCNRFEEKGKVTFRSTGLAEPADEHPPHQFFPEVPFRGNDMEFTLTR